MTATGVLKPAEPSKNAPKQKAISNNAGMRILQIFKAVILFGQLLQKNDVQHNSANWQQAGEPALHCRPACHVHRHAIGIYRDQDCRNLSQTGGDMRLDFENSRAGQHHHYRNGGHQVEMTMLLNGL